MQPVTSKGEKFQSRVLEQQTSLQFCKVKGRALNLLPLCPIHYSLKESFVKLPYFIKVLTSRPTVLICPPDASHIIV